MLVDVPALATALASAALLATAAAKPFLKIESTEVTQCGTVNFRYGGGRPPYTFTAVTGISSAQTMTLKGIEAPAKWQCSFPQFNGVRSNKVTFILEDSTRTFATASASYPIGASTSGSCDDVPPPAFQFDWKVAPRQQCDPVTFTLQLPANNGTLPPLPFSAIGVIPSGDVWRQVASPDSAEMTTILNVEAGNEVLFVVQDANGNQGGTSDYVDVVAAPNPFCLNEDTRRGPAKKSIGTGAIAGIAVGVVVVVLLIAGGAFYLYRRKKRTSRRNQSPQPIGFAIEDAAPEPFTGGYPKSNGRTATETDALTYESYHPALTRDSYAYTTTTGSSVGDDTASSVGYSRASAIPRKGGMPPPQAVEPTYRIQDDAGPVSAEPVIDMPPTYNPDWQGSPGSASGSRGSRNSTTQEVVSEKMGLFPPK